MTTSIRIGSWGIALALAVVPVSGASAADPGKRLAGSASYTCAFSDAIGEDTVVLAMDLRSAGSARPGQRLDVSGELTLTFSESAARLAKVTLAREATGTSSTMSIQVTAGEDARSVRVADVKTSPGPVGDTIVVKAPVRIADVVVPSDASGQVGFALPGNGYTSNTVGTSPAMVAFTAELVLSGGVPQTRRMACWLPDDKGRELGSVPVSGAKRNATGSGGPAGTATSAAAVPGLGLTSLGAPPAAAAPPATAAPGAASVAAAVPGGDAQLVYAPIPDATRSGEVVLPVWVLVVALAVVLAGCVGVALRGRARLRQLARTSGLREQRTTR